MGTFFHSVALTNDNGIIVTGGRDTTIGVDYAPLVLLFKNRFFRGAALVQIIRSST